MTNEENKNLDQKSEIALKEEKILEFWKENKIFEKSVAKEAPKGKYIFYDGPPFATGTPHYGHILGSTAKDVIGRYQTMCGYCVPRRWGWDCHGLPIENIVEKSLKISGRKAIEEMGVDKFVEEARSKVLTYVAEWKKTIDRIGRWVDFDNSYKTMDNTFIESVWWALSELHKKDLLYEGVRVLAYCPRCETPIANSEIAMDNSYKDIADISVYVKFRLKEGVGSSQGSERLNMDTYLVAWTTTPWTLPGNTAIAVNKNIDYVKVEIHNPLIANNMGSDGSYKVQELSSYYLILAKDNLSILKKLLPNNQAFEIKEEFKGSKLVGKSYEPIFPYYKNAEMPNKENIYKVWHADFVTTDMGTGIAHEAPAFGEDDMNLAREHKIPWIIHVDETGRFKKEMKDFAGLKVKPKDTEEDKDAHLRTDIEVIKYLQETGVYFAKEKITHSYPHCYRCDTPLLYYALPSWFVNIQKTKKEILKTGESINWVPSHLKDGRYKNIVESAPDWTISRNRFWASPLPIWKSASGKIMFVNGLEDLKSKTKKSGNKYFVMRHGESESNIAGVISSKVENMDHLTEKGKKQVFDAVTDLKNKKIDLIISSDLLRTKETAEIVQKNLAIPKDDLVFDKRIREVSVGDFEGKTWNDYFETFNIYEHYLHKTEGGESQKDVKLRVSDFLYDVEKRYTNRNILIVTHEGPARLLFAGADGLDNEATVIQLKNTIKTFGNAQVLELPFVPLSHNANYELDLHRPYIDEITLVDEKGEEYKRILEVVDCWFESGSMPFAQDHFPFENPKWKETNFPAGFVAEYIAQTRTWFYYTHVISAILFNRAPFKNVVTTGTVLAEDGQKMSKSKNNFPDPSILFNKYGVDALRFYLMSCPVMKGEDINFSEKSVQEISNKIINRFINVVSFYELYRDKNLEAQFPQGESLRKSDNVLDKWIMARLEGLVSETTDGMEKYDMVLATRPFELFIEDLSTWYLRRSRERIKEEASKPVSAQGYGEARQTLYFVLKTLAKLLAPFAPFVAEGVWLKLKNEKDEESVHLAEWPKFEEGFLDEDVINNMELIRGIVSKALEMRQVNNIKVRQPLSELKIQHLISPEYEDIIKEEVNVKKITLDTEIPQQEVFLVTDITPELKEEGNFRELMREFQDMRKEIGLTPNISVSVLVETVPAGKELIEKYKNEFTKIGLVSKINFEKNDGKEVDIDGLVFKIKITR